MLVLEANIDDLELVTSAVADIEVHLSAMQCSAATPPVVQPLPLLGPLASITSAATTQILDTSGVTDGHMVNVKHLNIYNNHGSTACVCTVQVNDGTNLVVLWKGTLLAGEAVVFDETGAWTLYDSNGQVKAVVFPAALQADMEAGTSLVLTVTPGRQHYHPSAAKFWVEFTGNSTTILASYNTTSITDGTTEATVTIATDFSSASWCVTATATGTATTVAAARLACARSIAAGSVIVFCVDGAATTALQDPSQWCVAGFGDQ